MSKSLEEQIKEILGEIRTDTMVGRNLATQYLLVAFDSSLAQYKREIREKIGMMSIYDIDDTPRSVINMHGYNDAIKDVLAELDKLNHTDKKEGGK